jgi:hypothetical protein
MCDKRRSEVFKEKSPSPRGVDSHCEQVRGANLVVRRLLDSRQQSLHPFRQRPGCFEGATPLARAKSREHRLTGCRDKLDVLGSRRPRSTRRPTKNPRRLDAGKEDAIVRSIAFADGSEHFES